MPEPRIIIFVRAPRPGFVKTRLAAAIGNEAACTAYCQLTEVVLSNLASLPHLEIRFTPDDAKNKIEPWLREGWSTHPQGEGDLGERMHRAFAEARGPAIIIGSDCPEVMLHDIQAATDALKTHDAIIGPASDGGYWLIGLNAPCPGLFEKIEWSTDTVLQTTLEKADATGISVKLLRELTDVDDWKSWSGWRESNPRYQLGRLE